MGRPFDQVGRVVGTRRDSKVTCICVLVDGYLTLSLTDCCIDMHTYPSRSFTFESDPDQHICEVQLVHSRMFTPRGMGPGWTG